MGNIIPKHYNGELYLTKQMIKDSEFLWKRVVDRHVDTSKSLFAFVLSVYS